jgi:hypothetical protein
MSPRGLSEAVDGLVQDLPKGKSPSAGWQRVLAEQTLNRLIETDPVIEAALLAGLKRLLGQEAALRGALATALDLDAYPNAADGPPYLPCDGDAEATEFQVRPFGRILLQAVAVVEEDASIEAFRRERSETNAGEA